MKNYHNLFLLNRDACIKFFSKPRYTSGDVQIIYKNGGFEFSINRIIYKDYRRVLHIDLAFILKDNTKLGSDFEKFLKIYKLSKHG